MSSAAEKMLMPDPARAPRSGPLTETDATAWRTLAVLCIYRVVLAAFIGVAFAFLNRIFNFGVVSPNAVMPTIVGYAVASLVLVGTARLREPGIALQVTAGVGVDVIAIVVMLAGLPWVARRVFGPPGDAGRRGYRTAASGES